MGAIAAQAATYAEVGRAEVSTSTVVLPDLQVVITGDAAVGQKLTATLSVPEGWTDTELRAISSPQWYRNGVKISGAQLMTYDLVPDDEGTVISFMAGGEISHSPVSTVPIRAGYMGYGSVVITGNFTVGSMLTATHEKSTDPPVPEKVTYQWYRMAVAIPGATGLSYTPTGADLYSSLRIEIRGSARGYNDSVVQAETPRIQGGRLKIGTPTISGTATVGQTLTALPGTSTDGASLQYMWYRDGYRPTWQNQDDGNTYKLTEADAGKVMTVEIKASKPGYLTEYSPKSAGVRVPVFWTAGAIEKKYTAMAAVLGAITSNQVTTRDGGLYQGFERGSIAYTPTSGALAVINGINVVWIRIGAQNHEIGYPTSEEYTPMAGGVVQSFQYGRISWNPVTGTRITKGGIGYTWDQAAGPWSVLGYPTTDEYVPAAGGMMQGFQYGKISWNPVTGSRITKGGIGATWDRLDGPASRLKYPTTNEYVVSGGGFAQDFQGGRITWRPGSMTVEFARR
jgi:hypothetical protein